MDSCISERINKEAGLLHRMSRKALRIDWYDTESQARRAIEFAAELYKLLEILTPLAAEQVQRDMDDGAVGMSDSLAAVHAAQELSVSLGEKP